MTGVHLDDDAKRIVAAASALARRHHHDTVEVEHLLAAILADDAGLFFDGIARAKLVALLDARIFARACSSAYRDPAISAESPLSAAASMALRRASTAYDLVAVGTVSIEKLLASLWHEPTIASIVKDATVDTSDLDALLDEAREVAIACRHPRVGILHFLAVARAKDWFVDGMRAVGGDRTKLRVAVESRLAVIRAKESESTQAPSLDDDLKEYVDVVTDAASSTRHGAARGVDLLRQLLHPDHRAPVFEEAGVPELPLLRWLGTGHVDAGEDVDEADEAETLAEDAELDVVFHDDDITSMEYVVTLLETYFDCSKERAVELMFAVHEGGEMVVGRFPAARARSLATQARVIAEEASVPLRISLRRP